MSYLAYLWPSGSSRWEKLYRGAVIAVIGALLTYLTKRITSEDFGVLTPAIVAFWSVVANAVRQAVENLKGEEVTQ